MPPVFRGSRRRIKHCGKIPAFWDVNAGEYAPDFEIIHISTFLARPEILAAIKEKVVHPLKELAIACYYGCLSLRNPRVTDAPNWEMPENLETNRGALSVPNRLPGPTEPNAARGA